MAGGDRVLGAGGSAIRYRLEGDGPPVALVHGVGSRLEAWDGVVRELGGAFRTLRYDLRGHGGSGKPPGPYGLDDFVADLVRLLDHLGVARCHVVGFSLGGLIGQAFALRHPERLDRLALISAIAGRTEEERARVMERLRTVEGGVSGEHFQRSVDRWFTPGFQRANPGVIAELAEANRRNDPAGYAAAYRVLAEGDLAGELHRIGAETLVMTGEHDAGSTPRMARLMAERIPGARLHILPGLRHSVLIEAPAVVAGILRDFLDRP